MGKLLDMKCDLDHRLLELVNFYRTIKSVSLSGKLQAELARTGETWKSGSDRRACLICGNGPSLNELTLSEFSTTDSFAANFFYKHTEGKKLNPKYYVITDSKIVDGIWPVTMIDEIFSVFPQTNLFVDVRWFENERFANYVGHPKIFGILPALFPHAFLKPRTSLARPICGLNVVASAISIATAMGYKKIGIAGVDGDGLFREILDMKSHFYDGSKDHSMRSFESMVKSLILSAENLWAWQGIVATHKAKGILLQNVCEGGIMDCMPRIRPAEFLKVP